MISKELLTSSPALIADAAVAVFILLVAVLRAKKGLYGTLMPWIVIILSVTIGLVASNTLTPKVLPTVWEKVETHLEEYYDTEELEDNSILDSLIQDTMRSKGEVLTEKLTKTAIFLVAFIVSLILLSIIKHHGEGLANWFAVGWVNHGGGFILGVAEGVVLTLIIIRGCSLFDIDFFNEYAAGTKLLSWFCDVDIKTTLQLLKDIKITW